MKRIFIAMFVLFAVLIPSSSYADTPVEFNEWYSSQDFFKAFNKSQPSDMVIWGTLHQKESGKSYVRSYWVEDPQDYMMLIQQNTSGFVFAAVAIYPLSFSQSAIHNTCWSLLLAAEGTADEGIYDYDQQNKDYAARNKACDDAMENGSGMYYSSYQKRYYFLLYKTDNKNPLR